MRLALFSDLHAHPFAQYARVLPNGRNSRLQDALDAMAEVFDAARKECVGAIVFGGDLFHTFGRIDTTTLSDVFDRLAGVAPDGPPLFLLVGNHDQADRSGAHALRAFRSLPHVVVMEKPGWHMHPRAPGLGVFAVPYTDDTNEVRRHLREAAAGRSATWTRSLAVLHAGFDGAQTGTHEYRMRAELSASDVPDGFDLVASGHYHQPQWIDQRRRIAYIGALTHQSWGDVNQPRGYALADLARGTMSWHETSAPRFVRVAPTVLGIIRAGDFVELVLPFDADEAAMAAGRLALESVGVGGGQVIRATAPMAAPTSRLGLSPTADLSSLIEPYVCHVTADVAARGELVALGRDLLRRASA